MLLASPLQERYQILHLDTSNKTGNVNRGRLDFHNVAVTFKNFIRLLVLLRRERPGLANIPIPKNRLGFVKFASFVLPCAWSGTPVTSRSGGGHFDLFYQHEAPWMKAFIRFTLRHVDAVIVRGECLKRPFERFLAGDKIWTVYPGLDASMFDGVPAIKSGGKKGVDVLYVGHLSKAKGVLDFLEAIPHVLAAKPDARFQLVGEILKEERNITFIDSPSNIANELNRLLAQERVRSSVEQLGVVEGEAKLKAFAGCDIFVLPSYAEGFPFAVLEAMLAGKAVVTTPVGALPEVFRHEEHLLFVEPGKPKEIARSIIRLIEDSVLRETLGQEARTTVRGQFNLEYLAVRMDEVFRYVLKEAEE